MLGTQVYNSFSSKFVSSTCHKRLLSKCVSEPNTKKYKIVSLEEAKRFIFECLAAVNCNAKHAKIVADTLVAADERGVYSHGMNRLEVLLEDIETKCTDPNALPTLELENLATAMVNGGNGLGPVNGHFCMDLAIKKASRAGICVVSCYRSNPFGMASMYTLQAVEKGYLGIVATNTSPMVVPSRAKDVFFGSNPISFGAPTLEGDSFILDMATSGASFGKIEMYKRKGESLPKWWALNEEGKSELDPEKVIKSRRLLPLGGTELSGGYKGYGLSMMLEILCGCLSGSDYGRKIRIRRDRKKGSALNLGHCFVALNPKAFFKDAAARIHDLIETLRKMEPIDPKKPVMVPGDIERINMQKVATEGGIRYLETQLEITKDLAKKLNVAHMKYK